jgi:hypothetical protein
MKDKDRIRQCALWVIFSKIDEVEAVPLTDDPWRQAKIREVVGAVGMAFHMDAIKAYEMDYCYKILFDHRARQCFPWIGEHKAYNDEWLARFDAWLNDGRLPTDGMSFPEPEPIAALAAAE